jgi:DNA-binding NarL/FixJ family response regulator
MTIRQHVFLTQRAEPLPRWLEAFPGAWIIKPESLHVDNSPVMVWLHLGLTSTNVSDQVKTAVNAANGNPVVVLANMPNDEEGLICLEAGAVGYISAIAVPEMMQQVVGVIDNGGLWVGPELMKRLRTALAAQRAVPQDETDRLALLSQREKEVALAVAAGASNKEIARNLGITDRTVKSHLTAIFERLRINNRVQLSVLVNGDRQRSLY